MRKKLYKFGHGVFSLMIFFSAGAGVALTVDAVQAGVANEQSITEITTKNIDPYWEIDYSGRRIVAKNLKNSFVVGTKNLVKYHAPDFPMLAWNRGTEPGELYWDEECREYRIRKLLPNFSEKISAEKNTVSMTMSCREES